MSESTAKQYLRDVVELVLGATAIVNGDLVPFELKILISDLLETEMFKKAEVYSIVFEEDYPVDIKTGKPVHATFIPIRRYFMDESDIDHRPRAETCT